jgi:RNA polymerase sigma factor (TIGR02999 family)
MVKSVMGLSLAASLCACVNPTEVSTLRRSELRKLPLPRWPLQNILDLVNAVTRILSAIDHGDPHAAEQLLPLVYQDLRKLAAKKMAQERPGQTLDATALVHEAYIRLVDVKRAQHWNSRAHFFAAAAEAMRRILVDRARRKCGQRRRRERHRRELCEADRIEVPVAEELLDLDDVLTKFAAIDPPAAELVKLRVFAGMTVDEVAEVQGISPRTVKRNWAYARAWLGRQMAGYGEG